MTRGSLLVAAAVVAAVALCGSFTPASAEVEVCGHDSPTCTPVSSGGLAATIILTVFPPVFLVCCWATLDCAKENDIDVGGAASACAKRVHQRRTPAGDAPMRSMSGRRRGSKTTVQSSQARMQLDVYNQHAGDPKLRGTRGGDAARAAVRRSTSLEMVTVDNNNNNNAGAAAKDAEKAKADARPRAGSGLELRPRRASLGSDTSDLARSNSLGNDQWRCALCSFKNSNMMPMCEQCGTNKSDS